METEPLVVALLTEIRDQQQRLLAEYTRVANESLALQRQAYEAQQRAIAQQHLSVDTQLRSARLYRRVLLVAAATVLGALVLLARLA